MVETAGPALSVVVAIVSDTTGRPDTRHLELCLAALIRQKAAATMEIIVPHLPGMTGIAALVEEYPTVRFVEVEGMRTYTGRSGSREHHDELRARGLAVARGSIIALIEDHGIPAPNWSANVHAGLSPRFAAVGGAIENGIDRPLNWAVYFCDFIRYQNPVQAGDSAFASDANIAYRRAALESIRPVWQDAFHEPSVNEALRSRGEVVALAPDMVLYQHRQGLRFGSALRERFVWGRSYAALRGRLAPQRRVLWALFSPALPALLLARMTAIAWKKRRTLAPYLKALPLTSMLLVSWALGELAGYVTARPARRGRAATGGSAR
ncbi:MAG TPA: hypothetical protein VK687_10680 [Bryobacteraceae bacterium]|nr:hypothetical protein [Bryobacteraceae bacterium]